MKEFFLKIIFLMMLIYMNAFSSKQIQKSFVYPENIVKLNSLKNAIQYKLILSQSNLINNPLFLMDLESWSSNAIDINGKEIIPNEEIIYNNKYNIYKKKNKDNISSVLGQKIKIEGQKSDLFSLSFWYKNDGILETIAGDYLGHIVSLNFFYKNDNFNHPKLLTLSRSDSWQFFQTYFEALDDYSMIDLNIITQFEKNNLYITGFSLRKIQNV